MFRLGCCQYRRLTVRTSLCGAVSQVATPCFRILVRTFQVCVLLLQADTVAAPRAGLFVADVDSFLVIVQPFPSPDTGETVIFFALERCFARVSVHMGC